MNKSGWLGDLMFASVIVFGSLGLMFGTAGLLFVFVVNPLLP